MSKLLYPAIFHPESDGYSVFVPDIDGCITQGDTLEDAYDMVFDAVGLCLEDFTARKEPLPTPSRPESIQPDTGDFVGIVQFDPIAYARRNNARAVKKTLTIPSWLNALAEENHVNFSKVLQSALMNQLDVADR